MDDTRTVAIQLPILTVRFAPNDLLKGAVDQEDFAQFLDGMKLALDGLAAHEVSASSLADAFSHPRLTVVNVRRDSVECDIIINLFSNMNITIDWQAVLTTGATGLSVYVIVQQAAKAAAIDMLKGGLERAAKDVVEQTKRMSSRFMEAMKAATRHSTGADYPGLPAELMLHMLPGLRKMARVGAKSAYGEEGVTVIENANPITKVAFNAEAQHIIEEHAKEALASREFIEMVGTIEDPSERRHKFVLNRHGQAKSNRYISCYYPRHHEDLVRALYARRAHVKVTGERRLHVHPNGPQTVVDVSSIEPTEPDDLWSSQIA